MRSRGKLPLTKFLSTYNVGDRVTLMFEPSVQKGQYHMRFYGKVGLVVEKRGSAYAVEFHDGGKKKVIITHPVHLARLL